MEYKKAYLLGRLSNGFESDRGILVHAVVRKLVNIKRRACPDNNWQPDVVKAERDVSLCGKQPGPQSVGWSIYNSGEEEKEVTCPTCLKKLAKLRIP